MDYRSTLTILMVMKLLSNHKVLLTYHGSFKMRPDKIYKQMVKFVDKQR